jgi:hypothetical protein
MAEAKKFELDAFPNDLWEGLEGVEGVEDGRKKQYDLAYAFVKSLMDECARGGRDREDEALERAKPFAKLEELVRDGFAKARAERRSLPFVRRIGGTPKSPVVIDAKPITSTEEWVRKTENEFFSVAVQPKVESEPKLGPLGLSGPPAVREADPPVSFFQHSKSPRGIVTSYENSLIALKSLKLDCRYNVFHDKIIVEGYESYASGDATKNFDNILLKLREKILRQFGFDAGKDNLVDALKTECLNHIFDPVCDYLDSLRWDGRRRVDRWLIDYCGAEDTPLNRAFSRKVLIAAVRRVRKPGCKFDYVLVLEGKQGIGKSSMIRILAGEENFSESEVLGLDKREQQEALQGVWLYEISELEGMRKADVTHIKSFFSKTSDKARPAYGRTSVDRPRRCVFVATTNEDNYLRDTTGNRRFWPVKVCRIDLAAIGRDRDQLWAEASLLEAGGEPLVIDEALWAAAAEQQSGRLEHDPWEDEIITWITVRQGAYKKPKAEDGVFCLAVADDGAFEWRISSSCLLSTVLGIAKERQSDAVSKRLARVMSSLGWHRPDTTIRIGSKVCRGFVLREALGEDHGV